MGDYDYLDQYEGHFGREVAHKKKVFDEPLANDPLTRVEDAIGRPDPIRAPLSPSPVKDFYDVPKADPLPPVRPYGPMGYRGPDAPRPDVLEGEHHRWWREPPIPRLRGGSPTGPKHPKARPDFRSRPAPGSAHKLYMVRCPDKNGDWVADKACKTCKHHWWKDPIHGYCKLKAREADRLAGKGK